MNEMPEPIASPEQFPMKFGEGKRKVTIYKAPAKTKGKVYDAYLIKYFAMGKAQSVRRAGRESAIKLARQLAKFLQKENGAFYLSRKTGIDKVCVPPDGLMSIAHKLRHFPLVEVPSVYFLVRGKAVVYVGKTTNLVRRVTKHFGTKTFDSVFYYPVLEGDITQEEEYHIEILKPIYNRTLLQIDTKRRAKHVANAIFESKEGID